MLILNIILLSPFKKFVPKAKCRAYNLVIFQVLHNLLQFDKYTLHFTTVK